MVRYLTALFSFTQLMNPPGTFPLKKTQGFFNDASHPRVVEKFGCVVLDVADWLDGINHPEWGVTDYEIFGPDTGPAYNYATYDFSTF